MILGYGRLILLVIIIGIITDICYAVPLSDFLPYGIDAGDTGFPPNDDDSTSFNLTRAWVCVLQHQIQSSAEGYYNHIVCLSICLSLGKLPANL